MSWNPYERTRSVLADAEHAVEQQMRDIWTGFVEFTLRDNVLEVAIGLIVATAFTKVVNSLVSDILLPPLSLLPFMSRNLEEKFIILKGGPHYSPPRGYNTRAQALADGAVTLAYGQVAFIDQILNLVGLGVSAYLIANIYGYLSHDSIIRHTCKCKYCKKEISAKAKRCPMCTSWLDGREEKVSDTSLPTEDLLNS